MTTFNKYSPLKRRAAGLRKIVERFRVAYREIFIYLYLFSNIYTGCPGQLAIQLRLV